MNCKKKPNKNKTTNLKYRYRCSCSSLKGASLRVLIIMHPQISQAISICFYKNTTYFHKLFTNY